MVIQSAAVLGHVFFEKCIFNLSDTYLVKKVMNTKLLTTCCVPIDYIVVQLDFRR